MNYPGAPAQSNYYGYSQQLSTGMPHPPYPNMPGMPQQIPPQVSGMQIQMPRPIQGIPVPFHISMTGGPPRAQFLPNANIHPSGMPIPIHQHFAPPLAPQYQPRVVIPGTIYISL